MHVAIDGVGNYVGGGWSVLSRTARRLATDPRVSRVSVFCSPLELTASTAPEHPKIHWLQHPWAHKLVGRLGWLRHWLDVAVEHVEADVVLTMNGAGTTSRPQVALVQQAFAVWGKLRRVRPLGFAAKLAVIRREMARSLGTADAVVVQTQWMRQRVRHVHGLEASVLPLGLPAAQVDDAVRDAGCVTVLGTDLPYKRYDFIREAVELAKKRHAVRLKSIDDTHPDDVPHHLARASALIMASDVESFGLPIVEAFAAGCPVVLTDRPWSRAVAGDAALYFEHGAPSSAAQRIVELASDPSLAVDLGMRGATRLTALWEAEPYAQLVDLLEDVA